MSDLNTPARTVRRNERGVRARLTIALALCASLLATAAFSAATASAATEPEIPPIVTTGPAVAVAGGFTLNGTIYTYSLDTRYHFEYGTSTAYGTNVPVPDADAGTNPVVQVSQTVNGLAPNTTYHFRIVAENSKGPGSSADATFTTASDPSAPPAPSPPAGGNEAGSGGPVKGKQLKLKAISSQGRSILATANGRSLYSLSVEKHGRFVCTRKAGCLALWHPLLVPAGTTLSGPVKLDTIKRPEGGVQATYRGLPLYTFAPDRKPGETSGQGLKDVGTWHPATVPKQKR